MGTHTRFFDSLEVNEYMVINSRNNTVIKYRSNGTTLNIYDLRAKEQSIFKKIPPGKVSLNWWGAFGFTLTLYLQKGVSRRGTDTRRRFPA